MSRLLFGLQQRGIYSFPRYIRVVSASRTPSRFHHLSPHETPKSGFSLAISCQSTVFKIRTQSFRLVSTFLALSRSGNFSLLPQQYPATASKSTRSHSCATRPFVSQECLKIVKFLRHENFLSASRIFAS